MIYELYNGEIKLDFEPEKHIYTVNGERKEGATGVTGIINKPMLISWAVNMAIAFMQENIKAGVAYDELQLGSMFKGAKYAHRNKAKNAADIGTLVHEAIETFVKTGNRKEPVHAKAKQCFQMFVKWADENKVEFLESERKVYSRELDYAGTCDFVCRIDGKLYVGDTKTSSGIYDEMWFQVAGYQQALEEELGVKYDGQIIVRVGKDGAFEVQYRTREDYEENVKAFNGALALYKRILKLKDLEKLGGQDNAIAKSKKLKKEKNNAKSIK